MAKPGAPPPLTKAPTGIAGFDELTRGGIPVGRSTLIVGGAGSGKTVLALQMAAHAAQHGEPTVFVAFEEDPDQIRRNVASFGWDLDAIVPNRLAFHDAVLSPKVIQAGAFDLGGLLATVGARAAAMKARRVVLDALDVPFGLVADAAIQRREVHRLHAWLQEHGLTSVFTAKAHLTTDGAAAPLGFLPYLTDCTIELRHDLISGVSHRSVRVAKYRGSGFAENAAPFVIGPGGVEVASSGRPADSAGPASTERISSGVARLDRMLGGGYFRGSSILVTGSPGTAKTTLAGAMLEAACKRGERGLFVSFDSEPAEIVRNLGSVGINLESHRRSGRLVLASFRSGDHRAELHLLRIRALLHEQRARVLVVDPVSALGKLGNEETVHGVVERLIDGAKADGVTVLCTSLLGQQPHDRESTPIQISTIADTWIHLTYHATAGERNRALTIVKARGTAHSNQVRELVLTDSGVTLADVYMAEGEVLMGTMRVQREAADRATATAAREATAHRRQEIRATTEALAARIRELQREIGAQEEALRALEASDEAATRAVADAARVRGQHRGVDTDGSPPSAASRGRRKGGKRSRP